MPRYLLFNLSGKDKITIIFDFNLSKLSILNKNYSRELKGKYLSIYLPTKIFNDCNTKKMYNTLTPSKIVKFNIANCNSLNLYSYLVLIDMYENELIPFKKLFNLEI